MATNDRYDMFYHEAFEYFAVKFPKEPKDALMEAAAFLANRALLTSSDIAMEILRLNSDTDKECNNHE